MRRLHVSSLAALAALLVPTWTSAGWWEVHRADAGFDLTTARREALATVAADPTGADAVAVAGWWLRQISNLPDPEEILVAAADRRGPELAFELARIEAALTARPPAGSLGTAEVSGPYGVFDTLDLERGVTPPDAALPPPGSRYADPWHPVRTTLTTIDGAFGPPDALGLRGVYTVLWTIRIEEAFDGWMVVEVEGGVDLSVDDRPVDRARFCGQHDARTRWYRIRLDRGLHRLRADLAGTGRPELRVSLYGDDGSTPTVTKVDGAAPGPWAGSEVAVDEPPAMAGLLARIEVDPAVPELLLAAAVAEQRRDPVAWRRFIERAAEVDPDSPWPRFALAWYWLTAPVSDDAEAVRRRAREQLRGTSEIPLSLLFERGLALRERRDEDDERYLEQLVEDHGDDVRIIRLWIGEALERGWVREAEDGLQRLQVALPGSREAAEVEIEVLEALERWQERQRLLHALADVEPVDLRLVDELARGCLIDDAVTIMRRLQERVADPDLDIELARLLFAAGEVDEASEELAAVRQRWGRLPAVDELALAVTAGDAEANARALDDALARSPASIDLLSLSWRRGATPFFEPYRLSLEEILVRVEENGDGVDAVLLLDQAVEQVFPDGSSLYYYHGVTRALTPVGAQQASRLQQLPNSLRLKIRIHKPDGSVVVPAVLDEGGAPLDLDDVEPGDLVEEEYVARVAPALTSPRGHLPPFIYRFADSERAFGLSEYMLLVPPDLDLLIEGNFEGLERSEWERDGLRVIRWRAERVPPVPEERFAPPTSELLPWVSYGFGVSWDDVGDALRDRLIPLLLTTPELDAWSSPLVTDRAPDEAVRALVSAVVDEVEAGRGDLDFSSSAGASFSRRSGNRLGIVAAVLLDAGWRVDLVMARTRPFAGTHLLVPTFDSFIQPLLRVVRDGDEIWLDLEQERQGIDHIDAILQGSDGLLIPLSAPREPVRILPELPTFANPELEEEMMVEAVVNAEGGARLILTLPIRGPQAERVVEQIRSVPTDRVPVVYQQMATTFIPSAIDVSGRIERVENGIDLELAMLVPGACQPDGEVMVCRDLVFSQPLAPVLAALPTRSFPLIMPVPVLQRHGLVVEVPEGWTMDQQARRLETRWGSVIETIERDGRRVRSSLRLELPAQTVSPEEYPEFARFCHAVDELISRPPRMAYTPGP